jgi:uncharacterized protein (TIGR00661 family)
MSRPRSTFQPVVLVAPLDWGLGHATRCIPLIHTLLKNNCTVLLAGSGAVRSLLSLEFPYLAWLELPGYGIRYAKQGWALRLQIVTQIPQILSAIKKEQKWLERVVQQRRIDAVISDNRYGLHHPDVVSVLITHQLRIQTGMGNNANDWLQALHYRFIQNFNACWVPDHEKDGLAGELSHPLQKPLIPATYLGPLSRFRYEELQESTRHILILLSGPEPQRTILEQLLQKQVGRYKGKLVWVRGLPQQADSIALPDNVEVHQHLPAAALEQKIKEANFVISRCGYSTVMDLMVLRKKAIFIPTPGQTEQIYLAQHLMEHNRALCIPQSHFQLLPALELAAAYPYTFPPQQEQQLEQTVSVFVESLQQKIQNRTV